MKRLVFCSLFLFSMICANGSDVLFDRVFSDEDYALELNYRYARSHLLQPDNFSLDVQFSSPRFLSSASSSQGFKYGYVAAPVVLGLSIASEITKQNQLPAMPLGISAVAITAISVPIIGSNARSLDSDWQRVKTASWVAYGGGMLCAGVLIATGIMEVTPPTPVIAVTGLMCATSIVLMTRCTNHSNSATVERNHKNVKLNFGLAPYKNGGIGMVALQF